MGGIPPQEEQNPEYPRNPPPPFRTGTRFCPGSRILCGGRFITRLRDVELPVTVERGLGNVMVSRYVPE
jgi:hypothetical protein